MTQCEDDWNGFKTIYSAFPQGTDFVLTMQYVQQHFNLQNKGWYLFNVSLLHVSYKLLWNWKALDTSNLEAQAAMQCGLI